jgi:excinuclease UvrABC ATPase subunit
MKIEYETECCTRCYGSGHYSYNQITGTRCFRCAGAGVTFTKRGKAAKDFALSLAVVNGSEIKIGDAIRLEGKGKITVQSIEISERRSFYKFAGDLEFPMKKIITVVGKSFSREFYADKEYKLFLTADQIEEVLVYQKSLTKAGKPRKITQ